MAARLGRRSAAVPSAAPMTSTAAAKIVVLLNYLSVYLSNRSHDMSIVGRVIWRERIIRSIRVVTVIDSRVRVRAHHINEIVL